MPSFLWMIIILFAMLLIGAPVILAIGTAGAAYFFIEPGMMSQMLIYPMKFFNNIDSFVFLCIPLFILTGELMSLTGMMNRLVRFCQILVGGLKGGLAYVNVLASMLFAGISGSALADISALGPIEINMMAEAGYDKPFSTALTAATAIQGPIIPPSIPMVLYASIASVSVGAMLFSGIIPGIMLGVGQMIMITILGRKKHYPTSKLKLTPKLILRETGAAITALLMPVIILGGVLSGIFTATESAAIAVVYALLIGLFVYRNLSFKKIVGALVRTARTTAGIYLIVAFTGVIGWVMAVENVPGMIEQFITNNNLSVGVCLLLANLFFLFNGCWISDTAQLLLFAPIFMPIFANMGISPIHFGCFMVVNVMISMITPPYGTALYLSSGISGVPLPVLVKNILPFLLVCIIVLFLVTYIPFFSMWIPSIAGLV